jgi:hypothetical protein
VKISIFGFRIFDQTILEFCPPLHGNLFLDPSGKNTEPKEETTAEQSQARRKDQPYISMGEQSDAFKGEREEEAQ